MERVEVTADSIKELLEGGGWPCEPISGDCWRTRFRGRASTFELFVRIDPAGFLTFAIIRFLKSPADEAAAAKLYDRLLTLNRTLRMAKFSIDDDLDVVISVEYPIRDLDRSEFDDALDVLSFYADKHYDELRALAEPPPA